MSDFVLPATRYALSGDVNIAYQVMGDGPMRYRRNRRHDFTR